MKNKERMFTVEYKAIKATKKNIEKYGYFIDEKLQEPLADNNNFTFWDKIAEFEMGPRVSAGIVIGHKNNKVIESIEQHKDTVEILVGLGGDALVLLGIPTNNSKKVTELKAFRIDQGETLILHSGIWHSAPVPVSNWCRMLVLFNTDTASIDLEEIKMEETSIICE